MDSQWLKTQFALNPGKTKAELAKAIGLEPSGISKILGGLRQIKAQEYAAMRRFFGLPVDGEAAVKPASASSAYTIAPLLAGFGEQEKSATQGAEWIISADILSARTQAPPEKIKKFQVRESAMEPDFMQGEHVLVDTSDKQPSPPGVFVVSDGFGYMVRHCAFVPKTDPPEITISANSANFHAQTLQQDDFLMVGRVIAKLQMV